MKIATKPAKVTRLGNMSESKFGIKSEQDLVHIFNVLRNKMYTNKPKAVVREYGTNAYDAHVEVGNKNRPFDVYVPTRFDPVLKIRDYGRGLSEEEIRETYCMYGCSTKRGTNEMVGQLGFGSKAGFAYSDSFTITSWTNGTKKTYSAYIDESGLGSLCKLSEQASSEHNGIEISIAVNSFDIDKFHKEIKETYRFFDVAPNIVNDKDFKIERPKYDYYGDDWGVVLRKDYYNHEKSYAIMGSIAYPIDANLIDDYALSNYINNGGMYVFCPIGSLSIAASREALEYDKVTIKTLKEKFNKIRDSLNKVVEKEISTAKGIVEAIRKLNKLSTSQLQNLISVQDINWNGKKINYNIDFRLLKSTYDKDKNFLVKGNEIRANSKNKSGITKYGADIVYSFDLRSNDILIKDIDDKWVLRTKTYLESVEDKSTWNFGCYVLEASKEIIDEMKSKYHIQDFEITYLSSIEPAKIVRNKSKRSNKHSKKAFKLKAGNTYYHRYKSDYWSTIDIDVRDKGYYVELFEFLPKIKNTYIGIDGYQELIKKLKEFDINITIDKIIGIKKAEIEKLGKGWLNINDVIERKITRKVKGDKTFKEDLYNRILRNTRSLSFSDDFYKKLYPYRNQILDGRIKHLIEPVHKVVYSSVIEQDKYNFIYNWINKEEWKKFIDEANSFWKDLKIIEDEILSEYSLLRCIDSFYIIGNEVVDYINLVYNNKETTNDK